MALADQDLKAAIAATRFGLGARPGEIAAARPDPRGFLRAQIRRDGADQPAGAGDATTRQRITEYREFQRERREARMQQTAMNADDAKPGDGKDATMAARDPVKVVGGMLRQDIGADFGARVRLAVNTDAGFRERWANFWANHFTVSATKAITGTIIGPFEAEAIRPHVFGRFADMLGAVETHPAMLTYLDQVQSIGPNSQAAEFQRTGGGPRGQARLQQAVNRSAGLNENLAREILELHTVGIGGGYTQADVTEFARAMTGLTVGGPRDPDQAAGSAVFHDRAHEPGERTVMGVRYGSGGLDQAGGILADLAAKPATARFICTKIARHFVADEPSPALVARLEAAWTASRGDLGKVAEALVVAPEAWEPTQAKFKTPYEFLISSYRAAGAQPENFGRIAPILTALGQKPFSAPSPKGWPEDAQSWAAPDAIVKRMQFAQSFSSAAVRDRDPKVLAADALGARLSPETAKAVARAESRPEGFALLLMSPEFQRR